MQEHVKRPEDVFLKLLKEDNECLEGHTHGFLLCRNVSENFAGARTTHLNKDYCKIPQAYYRLLSVPL